MSSNHKNLSQYDTEAMPHAAGYRFGIAVSSWNKEITGALLNGAIETLLKHGVREPDIHVFHVPGSFELPLAAQWIARSLQPDAVICLGCVIQGETRHFDFVCKAVTDGINRVGLDHNMPVIFGVLTTENLQQAIDRSGGRFGNKGTEAAAAALQMAGLGERLKKL